MLLSPASGVGDKQASPSHSHPHAQTARAERSAASLGCAKSSCSAAWLSHGFAASSCLSGSSPPACSRFCATAPQPRCFDECQGGCCLIHPTPFPGSVPSLSSPKAIIPHIPDTLPVAMAGLVRVGSRQSNLDVSGIAKRKHPNARAFHKGSTPFPAVPMPCCSPPFPSPGVLASTPLVQPQLSPSFTSTPLFRQGRHPIWVGNRTRRRLGTGWTSVGKL